MSFAIREARPGDLASLVAADSYAAEHPERKTSIVAWVEDGHAFLAEAEGICLGYAVIGNSFFGQPFLEMLMIAPGHRGRGVGRALLRHRAGAPGAKLWTSTNESNVPMRRLLESEDFTFAGRIEGLDEGDPELFFYRQF